MKYRIYSAHDTNVAAWLMILGQMETFEYKYVPYSAHIVFEVYRDVKGLYVQTIYNGHHTRFGNCEYDCRIDKFNELLANVTF